MPNRIDATMQPVQPTREDAFSNRIFTRSEATQLIDRDHPVLPIRNLCDQQVPLGDFPGHIPW